jgi:5-formyltetrahydrofolate cyclo-ligase
MDRDLQAGLHGIPEPHPESLRPVPLEEVDLMVLPLAAFDPAGNRLGYGRGYYDRLLGSATTRPLLIGAAFEIQCVDAIPHEPHDVRLDWIVTEERGLNFYGSL